MGRKILNVWSIKSRVLRSHGVVEYNPGTQLSSMVAGLRQYTPITAAAITTCNVHTTTAGTAAGTAV